MEKILFTLCRELNNSTGEAAAHRPDRYMDILLSLLIMIEEGQIDTLLAPESIQVVDNSDRIRIIEKPNIGLLYSAPEVIFEDGEYDARAQLFSLGLIIFYMLYAMDYYTAAGLNVLELEAVKRRNQEALIHLPEDGNGMVPAEYYGKLREVMKYLTSWEPEERDMGKRLLIDMYSSIDSINRVYCMDGNRVIATIRFTSRKDMKGFPPKNDEITVKGFRYRFFEKIDIPYRPGIHEYRIRMRKVQ